MRTATQAAKTLSICVGVVASGCAASGLAYSLAGALMILLAR